MDQSGRYTWLLLPSLHRPWPEFGYMVRLRGVAAIRKTIHKVSAQHKPKHAKRSDEYHVLYRQTKSPPPCCWYPALHETLHTALPLLGVVHDTICELGGISYGFGDVLVHDTASRALIASSTMASNIGGRYLEEIWPRSITFLKQVNERVHHLRPLLQRHRGICCLWVSSCTRGRRYNAALH